jgi:hypothetical protein
MIGTATESCIRLLSDFNKLGLIKLVGKKNYYIDIIKLKRSPNKASLFFYSS